VEFPPGLTRTTLVKKKRKTVAAGTCGNTVDPSMCLVPEDLEQVLI